MSDTLAGDWIVELTPRSKKLLLDLVWRQRNKVRQALINPRLRIGERESLETDFAHVNGLITSIKEAKTYD